MRHAPCSMCDCPPEVINHFSFLCPETRAHFANVGNNVMTLPTVSTIFSIQILTTLDKLREIFLSFAFFSGTSGAIEITPFVITKLTTQKMEQKLKH